jgi:hypothetical protein
VAAAQAVLLQPLQSKAAGFQKPLDFFFIPIIQIFHLLFFCTRFGISGDRPPKPVAPPRRLYTQKTPATTCVQMKTRGRMGLTRILHYCSEVLARGKPLKELLPKRAIKFQNKFPRSLSFILFDGKQPFLKKGHNFMLLVSHPTSAPGSQRHFLPTNFVTKESQFKGHPPRHAGKI